MNNEKRILVTGASKGIGRATALTLAKEGYSVLIHYNKDKESAKQLLEEIISHQASAELIQFDISNREQCRQTLESDIYKNGAYYGIVCNAGITHDTAFPAMEDHEWDNVINTNLGGFYNVVRPCVLPMIQKRKGGRIIVLTSVSGITGNRGQVNYSASKAGLIGATKSLAIELAKRNITVNCVAPGLIDTGMVNDEIFQHTKAMIPMQRMGKAQEVADLISFLVSEKSNYITRQVISVNGGMV